jgi:hypothetical protein
VANDIGPGVSIRGNVSEVGGILSPADGFRGVGFVWVLRDEVSGVAGLLDVSWVGGARYLLGSISDDALNEAVCGNLRDGSEKAEKTGFHHGRHLNK